MIPNGEVVALLEKGALKEAIELLKRDTGDRPKSATLRLLGVALFRLERYGEAAQRLEEAVAAGDSDPALAALLERARANALADVQREVPPHQDFDLKQLAAGPKPGSPAPWRDTSSAAYPRTFYEKLLGAFGRLIGQIARLVMAGATRLLGRESGESLWTTWYRRSGVRALLMLAYRRHQLESHNLFDAYAEGQLVGFTARGQTPPPWALRARTADGSWNDRDNPMAGAAGVRFGFNTDPSKTPDEVEGGALLVPNPRTVSRVLLTRLEGPQGFKPVPFLNLLAASWIQYMVHDWVSYGDPSNKRYYRIPLDEDDPARKLLHQTHMVVGATQSDPTTRAGDPATTHINEVSAWWDGSQLYGTDEKTTLALRTGTGGRLRLDPRTGNLPLGDDGMELAGFRRNWWLGLSMLHTLFAREHNAICTMLAGKYPRWDDQRFFDTARLVNAAEMAKIHTIEWTPAILPNKALNTAMSTNWYGLLTNLMRSRDRRKTIADINVADPVAGGIVGNPAENHGVPYSLSREFLAVYRLHSLLPDELEISSIGSDGPPRRIPLMRTRQAASHGITDSTPMRDLFASFGVQHPGQLVLNNYPRSLQNLSVAGNGFIDLGAIDILRDRERGVPRYNQLRRLLGLNPIGKFEDLTDDAGHVRALKSVYDDVEQIDLLIGTLAEGHRPTDFGFGETMFDLFILNASRRLQADRFFTDDYDADTYTPEGLAWIEGTTFKDVLLRHYPELAATGLANVANAFEPWDSRPFDPARHPLRRYDTRLRAEDAREGRRQKSSAP